MIRHGQPPYLECSSRGYKPFSAFYARINNAISIEELYQRFKIFEDGSTNISWREAKGRRAVNAEEATVYYKELWRTYLEQNPDLVPHLLAAKGLSDMFGQEGHVCQATVLWELREEMLNG